MREIQSKLNYADAIADWFLELAEGYNLRDELEEGLKCTHIAANILCKQNRDLSSNRLESNLRLVADSLSERYNQPPAVPVKTRDKKVCLHVLSEALPVGGITSMAIRWMSNDRSGRVHSVALLSKRLPIPDDFLQAVTQSGGGIYTANPADSMLHKAVWLKNLSYELADYVILHIDVSDVICGAAFGTKGGPPVLLINYNAHIFWSGASIADLVVNIRGSALEELWTERYRGILRYATIPIPLPEKDPPGSAKIPDFELKQEAKKFIGIPTGGTVILSVGASFKYLPSKGLDFIEVCESILQQLPEAFLLVVGFDADDRWKSASSRSGSRIRTLGTVSQSQLAVIHDAADVYIEGFPFGTTTSLLEAGLKGIPVVLAPAQCPPPYGSDGVALDDTLERPSTIGEYKTMIVRLCKDPVERSIQGDKIRNSVTKHHIGSGWKQYLEDAISGLPHEHFPQPLITPVRTPETINEYWSTFVTKWGSRYEESLESAVGLALSFGLRPRLTRTVLRSCAEYRSLRHSRTIPLPLLLFLCNFLFPVLPVTWDRGIFRLFSFLCRASLLSRVRKRVMGLFGRGDGRLSWYDEYRKMQDD